MRERPAMKSKTAIGLGKKQREWAGVQIGDIVKGNVILLLSYFFTVAGAVIQSDPYHPPLLPLPPPVRSYDASKDLGSLTIELSFLESAPKLVEACMVLGGISTEKLKEREK